MEGSAANHAALTRLRRSPRTLCASSPLHEGTGVESGPIGRIRDRGRLADDWTVTCRNPQPDTEAPSGTRNLRLPHTHIYVCICVSCGQTVGRAPSSRPMQLIRFIFRFGTNRNSTGRLERGVPG